MNHSVTHVVFISPTARFSVTDIRWCVTIRKHVRRESSVRSIVNLLPRSVSQSLQQH